MPTKPLTIGLCHKLIEMLEHKIEVLAEQMEIHGRICDLALMEKDKQLLELKSRKRYTQ